MVCRGDFDIVHGSGNENVSPVLLVENNLGLASWCVKHVYQYAYAKVFQHTQKIWRYGEITVNCIIHSLS